MYNEARKNQFIASYTKSIKTISNIKILFERIAEHELKFGKDLCEMSEVELQAVFDDVLGVRTSSKWGSVPVIKGYFNWCNANKLPGQYDNIQKVNLIGVDKIRKQMVASPLHLQRYLDTVFDPEDQNTIDNVYRCYFWMAFMGISEGETILVSRDEVDIESLQITHNGVSYPLYREAIPAFKNVVQLTEFAYHHPNYTKMSIRSRVGGDAILRGIKANAQIAIIRPAVSKRVTDAYKTGLTDQIISFHRSYISGHFYRMYEAERAGIPVNFSEIAIEELRQSGEENPDVAVYRRSLSQKIRNYTSDYIRWKLAFSI